MPFYRLNVARRDNYTRIYARSINRDTLQIGAVVRSGARDKHGFRKKRDIVGASCKLSDALAKEGSRGGREAERTVKRSHFARSAKEKKTRVRSRLARSGTYRERGEK